MRNLLKWLKLQSELLWIPRTFDMPAPITPAVSSFLNGSNAFRAAVDTAMQPGTPRGRGLSRGELDTIVEAYVATEGRFFDGGADALAYAQKVKPALAEVLGGVTRSASPDASRLYSTYVGAQVRYDLAQSNHSALQSAAPSAPQSDLAQAKKTIFNILGRGASYATDVNQTASLLGKVTREKRVSGADFAALQRASRDEALYVGLFKAADSITQMPLQWLKENPAASRAEFESFLRQMP